MVEIINILLLIFGLIYTFFLPGLVIIETFFKDLSKIERIPLILVLSVLISTYTVFLVSLMFGYSAETILISSLPFVIWTIIWRIKTSSERHTKLLIDHFLGLFLALLVFLAFLIALLPAIFSFKDNYYVLSAVNWQDTAMHISIIETISQGNFPPQAPYFSGYPLNYYYFIDFHSAILETLYGKFFPQILILDNPFFSMTFFLSVYVLSFYIFPKKRVAVLAAILATFYGSFMFIRFFQDWGKFREGQNFWNYLIELLTNHGYTLEYGKLFQVTPMADYFLQNRPMMIGLPAITLIIFCLLKGFADHKKSYLILAGIIGGALIKFQLFGFLVALIIFGLITFVFILKKGLLEIKFSLWFFLPINLFLAIFFIFFGSGKSVISIFFETFSFGPWDKTKDLFWYLSFYLANFGLPWVIFLISSLYYLFHYKSRRYSLSIIFLLGAVLFLIPQSIRFTIYEGDMFKFFYFMFIPFSIITAIFLDALIQKSKIFILLTALIIFSTSFTSVLTLSWSFLNKYEGYSQAEYQSGIWIRNKTPKKAVFVTYPSVHSAVSEIGGRLRVLSYIVWPYSHGFNTGDDNVFSRQSDIERLYQNSTDQLFTDYFQKKYNAIYLYLGKEERQNFPLAEQGFASNPNLNLVYNFNDIKIYQFK